MFHKENCLTCSPIFSVAQDDLFLRFARDLKANFDSAESKTTPPMEFFSSLIITTRLTGDLHIAYKARFSSRDLSPSLSLRSSLLQPATSQPLERVFVFLFCQFVHR